MPPADRHTPDTADRHTPDTADLVMQVHLVPVNRQQGTVGVALTIPLKRRDLAPIAFAKVLGDNMPSLIKEYQDKNPAPDVLELKAEPVEQPVKIRTTGIMR